MSEFLSKAVSLITSAGGKIIVAILVFIVGRIVIGALTKAWRS